ncbi:bifunctional 2-polyprenyl-6-hydroxyphenol methylase/3-demethylubiquinol 3-O-methyltransferase UbiG [Occultella aeris]|uniref:Methyltransferase domain protein n=1 Tax=Occultella aeris TaxID=2761496 RepID=A0A7M4DRI7_9MICO|nr:class I SAM-dependent methyltransferase [Occultella aeris]VZO40081.1 Methyltransferase domain protein [Occultella aeris]
MTGHATIPEHIDLDQARKRARELLTELRRHEPATKLALAQHRVAQGLGFSTWPALVRANERFTAAAPDGFAWHRITRVSIVCFRTDPGAESGAVVALYRHDGGWLLPSDRRLPGEDVWDDSVLRIALARMGFRRQGTHLLAVDASRRHCVFWVDGDPYQGERPHRGDAQWWTGPADAAAELLAAQGDGALARLVLAADEARRTITYDQVVADNQRTLVGPYLRADTPQGGSGFGGTARDWRDARGVLADALDPGRASSTFLDLACANGHLAVSMVGWGAERGAEVIPYGVDIAPELVERARELHPEVADHFWIGDALTWQHPDDKQFDLVHMLLDVIPEDRHAQLIDHLLAEVVAPGGRLLLSQYGPVRPALAPEAVVERLGHRVAGRCRSPQRRGRPDPGRASVWLERS